MKLSLVLKSIVISNIKIFFGKCIIKQGGGCLQLQEQQQGIKIRIRVITMMIKTFCIISNIKNIFW